MAIAALVILTFGGLASWRARQGDPQLHTLWAFGVRLGALGGTRFDRADLTAASFAGARLARTSFAGARLERVCWRGAQGLARAHLKDTILAEPAVRDLLVSGTGAGGRYAGMDLHGAWLQGCDLHEAVLADADLSDADLRGADLRGADLSRARVLGADLGGADLTGACLAQWSLDGTTGLAGAQADHVYLAPGRGERQPPEGSFQPGEFAKLFQQVAKTLDFLVHNRLELDALLRAVETLRQAGQAGLAVQAVERREDALVVRVAAPPELDREVIYAELKRQHAQEIRLLEVEFEARLVERQARIDDLKGLLQVSVERPITIHTEAHAMNDQRRTQHIRAQTISGGVFNLGEIRGAASTAVQQVPAPAAPDQPDLRATLARLQSLIEQAPQLSDEDKVEALKKVREIAESSADPAAHQGLVKTAVRFFQGLAQDFKNARKLAQEIKVLMGPIRDFFGLNDR